MVGFAELKDEFDKLGVQVFAASVDPVDKAQEVADEVNFPVGHSVSRDIANALGSYWEDRRQIIQPSEFIVGADGNVAACSYSDGPLGRIDAADVLKMVNFYDSQNK